MVRRGSQLIEVRSLSYIYNRDYPDRTPALDGVSFSINRGEIIGIIGPSGSGKSCLLRCLAGVLIPTSGVVLYDGEDRVPSEVGLIIQEPEVQFFNETVYQEIAFALENRGYNKAEIVERVEFALEKTGFPGETDRSPFSLSGGEQRRVAMAVILALEPQLLFLDEPTVGLDYSGLEMVDQIIEDFREKEKLVLIVSHDLDFLYRRVDRYLVLDKGKLVADFDKNDYERNIKLLTKLGLAIPELIEVKEKGYKIGIDGLRL